MKKTLLIAGGGSIGSYTAEAKNLTAGLNCSEFNIESGC